MNRTNQEGCHTEHVPNSTSQPHPGPGQFQLLIRACCLADRWPIAAAEVPLTIFKT